MVRKLDKNRHHLLEDVAKGAAAAATHADDALASDCC